MNLALATMTQNQGLRLKEWVEYHSNLGVNKFIIFLDNCTDESEKILLDIKDIKIDIHITSNINPNYMMLNWIERSHKMYDYVLKNYSDFDWISFIEVDEFIYPQKDIKLTSFLETLNSNCLYVNSWDFKGAFDEFKPILGQSNLIWTDKQRFNSDYKFRGKSIIKPKNFSSCIDAHHFRNLNGETSSEFKVPHENYIQVNYGKEITMDDNLFRIYHFRNHTPKDINDYRLIEY